jgi:thiol:disulfide interchange protein
MTRFSLHLRTPCAWNRLLLASLLVSSTHAFMKCGLLPTSHKRLASTKCEQSRDRGSLALATRMNWEPFGGFFLPPPDDRRRREAQSGMPIVVIDIAKDEELESLLLQADVLGKMVCVDWYASWCRKCIYLEPRFKRIARDHQESVMFARVDALELEWYAAMISMDSFTCIHREGGRGQETMCYRMHA